MSTATFPEVSPPLLSLQETQSDEAEYVARINREDALLWAQRGLATSKCDRCDVCGGYYRDPPRGENCLHGPKETA